MSKNKKVVIVTIISMILIVSLITVIFIYRSKSTNISNGEDNINTMQEDTVTEENNISNSYTNNNNEQNTIDNETEVKNSETTNELKQNNEQEVNQESSTPLSTKKGNSNNTKNQGKQQIQKTEKIQPQQEQNKSNVKQQEQTIQTKKQEETTSKPIIEKCTTNNNHGMSVGNSNKWFNSKAEAVAVYESKIKEWGNKWEKFEIDDATYEKNCPYGYEVWSCPYCGKWTINYYYN